MSAIEHSRPSRDWRIRLGHYWRLVRADRPIGIYLLLWPALWALWLAAGGVPPWWTLLVFVLKIVGGILKAFPDEDPIQTGPTGGAEQEIAVALAAVSSYKESVR